MILIATRNGILSVGETGELLSRVFDGHHVAHLAFDAQGGLLAIVDEHTILRGPQPADATQQASWKEIGRVPSLRANCLAELDADVFIGAADARMFALHEKGGEAQRLSSFDEAEGRENWDTPWGGPPDVRSLAVIRDPEAPAIYADIHVGGIMRSFDSGRSWSPAPGKLHRDVHQVATHADKPDAVFAATQQGFFRSDDRAESWLEVLDPFLPRNYQRAVCVDCEDPDLMYVTASLGPHPDGETGCEGMIFRSIDGGHNWAAAHEGLPDTFYHNLDTHAVAASRSRTEVLAFHDGADRVFVSKDGALSWRPCFDVSDVSSLLVT